MLAHKPQAFVESVLIGPLKRFHLQDDRLASGPAGRTYGHPQERLRGR